MESCIATIYNNYEPNDVDKDLLLLVLEMCKEKPEARIPLYEIKERLERIYNKIAPIKTYEVRCNPKTINKYCEANNLHKHEEEQFNTHIQNRTKSHNAYIRQVYNDKHEKCQLEITINDLVFICSNDIEDSYLFCYEIREHDKKVETIRQDPNHIERRDRFIFVGKDYRVKLPDDSYQLKRELDKRFKIQESQTKQNEIDKRSIRHEEELLNAEKRV